MERDEIVELIQAAHYQLRKALRIAPKQSNLSDDIDRQLEELDSIQRAVGCGEYDETGMAV